MRIPYRLPERPHSPRNQTLIISPAIDAHSSSYASSRSFFCSSHFLVKTSTICSTISLERSSPTPQSNTRAGELQSWRNPSSAQSVRLSKFVQVKKWSMAAGSGLKGNGHRYLPVRLLARATWGNVRRATRGLWGIEEDRMCEGISFV